LFFDNQGRIVTYYGTEMDGTFRYDHLVLTNEYAELHLITALDFMEWSMGTDNWDAWQAHHWHDWDRGESWMYHNPVIFGTDIKLTPIQPLADVQDEITTSISGSTP
jgi:hypothetical protein